MRLLLKVRKLTSNWIQRNLSNKSNLIIEHDIHCLPTEPSWSIQELLKEVNNEDKNNIESLDLNYLDKLNSMALLKLDKELLKDVKEIDQFMKQLKDVQIDKSEWLEKINYMRKVEWDNEDKEDIDKINIKGYYEI